MSYLTVYSSKATTTFNCSNLDLHCNSCVTAPLNILNNSVIENKPLLLSNDGICLTADAYDILSTLYCRDAIDLRNILQFVGFCCTHVGGFIGVANVHFISNGQILDPGWAVRVSCCMIACQILRRTAVALKYCAGHICCCTCVC